MTMSRRLDEAAATPTIRLEVEMMPSFAPSTAARNQPMRSVRCGSGGSMRLLRLVRVAFGGTVTNQHGAHQTAVGVIEDVAMEHPLAWTFIKGHQQTNRRLHRNVDRVLECQRSDGPAFLIHNLEEEAVQVERMIPV